MSRQYLVIVERAPDNYAACSPDLPGVAATGATREETLQVMEEAMRLHLRGLQEDGIPVPEPMTTAEHRAV